MIKIEERDGLESWLKGKSDSVAILIGVRAAFRAAPFLSYAYEWKYSQADDLTLQTFRALAIAWLNAAGDSRNVVAASAAADAAAGAADAAADMAYAAASAADAASAAASAANLAARAVPTAAVRAVSAAASAAARIDSAIMWQLLSSDLTIFDHKRSLSSLVLFPLDVSVVTHEGELVTHEGEAVTYKDRAFQSSTSDFISRLRAQALDWSIWIDWYKDRLAGRAQNTAFEKAFLSLTDEDWKQGAVVVNARLKELMDERLFENVSQRPAAFTYYVDEAGIHARPFRVAATISALPDNEEIFTLLNQLHVLVSELSQEGYENRPLAQKTADILDAVRVSLSQGSVDDINPGGLAMSAEVYLELAKRFASPEAQEQFTPDIIARAIAFSNNLRRVLTKFIEPELIEEEASGLEIPDDDTYEQARIEIKELQEALDELPTVDEEVTESLQLGEVQIAEVESELEVEFDAEKRIGIKQRLKSLFAKQLLNVDNLFRALSSFVLRAKEWPISKEISEFSGNSWKNFKETIPGWSPHLAVFFTVAWLINWWAATAVLGTLVGMKEIPKRFSNPNKLNKKSDESNDS